MPEVDRIPVPTTLGCGSQFATTGGPTIECTNGAAERRAFDRRRFLLTTATGLAAAGMGAQLAAAATDDDLAVANFGLASSYLAADYYAKALASGKLGPDASALA